MKFRRAVVILAVFLLLPCAAASSLSIDELDANAGVLFLFSNPPNSVDPHVGIPLQFGISVPFRLSGPFFLEAGVDFFAWQYIWNASSGSATIIEWESGVGFKTIGTLISMQGGVSFPISSAVSLGGAIGLDFLLRFPFELQNTTDANKADQSSGLSWFYGSGRFFYPETRFFLRWHVTEPVDLLVNLRAFYPVFHLWGGSGQPFWDQLMVSFGIGFGIKLGSAPK